MPFHHICTVCLSDGHAASDNLGCSTSLYARSLTPYMLCRIPSAICQTIQTPTKYRLIVYVASACRAISFLQKLASTSRNAGIFSSTQALSYWSYHLARSGFFTFQGLAGVSRPHLQQTVAVRGHQGSQYWEELADQIQGATNKGKPLYSIYLQGLQ